MRHPVIVAAGRHYGMQVHTCVPFESKGGSEATVRIAKADLVPTKANLLNGYNCFAELGEACEVFCEKVNGRVHRETARVPVEALQVERTRLHPLPVTPFTAALGETRTVDDCVEQHIGTLPSHRDPEQRARRGRNLRRVGIVALTVFVLTGLVVSSDQDQAMSTQPAAATSSTFGTPKSPGPAWSHRYAS